MSFWKDTERHRGSRTERRGQKNRRTLKNRRGAGKKRECWWSGFKRDPRFALPWPPLGPPVCPWELCSRYLDSGQNKVPGHGESVLTRLPTGRPTESLQSSKEKSERTELGAPGVKQGALILRLESETWILSFHLFQNLFPSVRLKSMLCNLSPDCSLLKFKLFHLGW